MTTDHVSIKLAKLGAFKNEGTFRAFLKQDLQGQETVLIEAGFEDLTSMLYENDELADYIDIRPEAPKTRNRKVKSYALPKIKDPELGKVILTAIINHKSFADKKDTLMDGLKRIPSAIDEQAELVDRLNELLKGEG